jgi:hypothetical protein
MRYDAGTPRAPNASATRAGIEHDAEPVRLRFQEGIGVFAVLVDVDGDDLDAARLELPRQPIELGEEHFAVGAPACPDFQQHDLAAEVSKTLTLAFWSSQLDVDSPHTRPRRRRQ